MFNLQGSEIIFILLLALVVLGPEKLPGAIKRATQTYNELRKMSSGFQSEFKSVIDEPMRELRATTDLIKNNADPKRIAEAAERDAAAAAVVDHEMKPVSQTISTDPIPVPDAVADPAADPAAEAEADPERVVGGDAEDPFDDPLEESA